MTHASSHTVSHRDECRLENRFDSFESGRADDGEPFEMKERFIGEQAAAQKLQIARANSLNVRYRQILRDVHA
jgi:hypothetical protein